MLALLTAANVAPAQDAVRWTTNYYRVTGSTPREIRTSIGQNRPWKQQQSTDAMTSWNVRWDYTFASSAAGCRVEHVRTTTTIALTMPLWVPSTNATAAVKERWGNYYRALLRHEGQHAELAMRAAAEIRSQLASAGERANCQTLTQELNALGSSILTRYRAEEREFDRRTQHGAVDGARFP